jgi:hypothetical protein
LSPKRILGIALIAGFLFPVMACDDTTGPEPPPPPPQISVQKYYTKSVVVDENGNAVQTGLQSNDVYTVFVTSTDQLWVGNQEGVALYNVSGGTRRIAGYDQNNGLPNPKVRTIAELDGKLYVGTWGGGIGVYDLALETWSTLAGSEGYMVADLKVDEGKLYVAANGAVGRYDPAANPGEEWETYLREGENVSGDLLDEYVSAIEIANTPRGKEYWYMPRWESGIDPGDEGEHGITVTRGDFNATPIIDTLQAELDNTLYEDPDGALSNGLGRFMFAGMNPDGRLHRAVLKFDVAGPIPADNTILDATLTLYNNQSGFFPARAGIYRALASWGEGTSLAVGETGEPSTDGDATWKHRFYPDTEWTNLGGDFEAEPSATELIRGAGFVDWPEAGTISDVGFWLKNPTENHGWVIANDDSIKHFSTRQYPAPGEEERDRRPTLVVTHAKFRYMTAINSDLAEPNVNDVYYDEAADLFWIAFSTKGLAAVDVANATWKYFTTDNGLPSNTIYSITEVDGVIWVGTQRGLARQRGNGSFQAYDRGGGLPADRVRRVYSDNGARLWLGFVEAGAALVSASSAQ